MPNDYYVGAVASRSAHHHDGVMAQGHAVFTFSLTALDLALLPTQGGGSDGEGNGTAFALLLNGHDPQGHRGLRAAERGTLTAGRRYETIIPGMGYWDIRR